MAKRRKGQPRRPARRDTPTEETTAAATSSEVDFGAEYSYVLGDLRRIGVLALAMFATLVALALIIQ